MLDLAWIGRETGRPELRNEESSPDASGLPSCFPNLIGFFPPSALRKQRRQKIGRDTGGMKEAGASFRQPLCPLFALPAKFHRSHSASSQPAAFPLTEILWRGRRLRSLCWTRTVLLIPPKKCSTSAKTQTFGSGALVGSATSKHGCPCADRPTACSAACSSKPVDDQFVDRHRGGRRRQADRRFHNRSVVAFRAWRFVRELAPIFKKPRFLVTRFRGSRGPGAGRRCAGEGVRLPRRPERGDRSLT
jgi:hypothetical protein